MPGLFGANPSRFNKAAAEHEWLGLELLSQEAEGSRVMPAQLPSPELVEG